MLSGGSCAYLYIMGFETKALRAFIGAKDFEISRSFYKELGFHETFINDKLSLFENNGAGFYLQDYYVKEWLENIMLFIQVDDAEATYRELQQKDLDSKFPLVKLMPVRKESWGAVSFMLDPSGVLLQFGQLY